MRGRRAALAVATLGIATLLGAGFAQRRELAERWYIWRLGSADLVARFRAARSLGKLRSKRAVPGLVALLRDSERHEAEAAEVWGSVTSAPDAVARTLEAIGPAECLPALEEALRRSKGEKRYWRRVACNVLARSRDPTAVPGLTELVDDGYLCVRLQAIHALGTFGPLAKGAVPSLRLALADRNTKATAETALEAIEEAADTAP